MRYLKQLGFLSVLGFALIASGLYSQATEAAICCRIQSNGVIISSESHPLCNTSGASTRRLSTGNYEVDFDNPPFGDVRRMVKLITLDTQFGGSTAWMVGVSDRSGDTSSVFVKIRNNNNGAVNSGFNLCLF